MMDYDDNHNMIPRELEISPEEEAIIGELMHAHDFGELKKTQAHAFEANILGEGNDLLIAKTGNGKTLTAEAVSLKHLQQGDRIAYLVPSQQLVWSKKSELETWGESKYEISASSGKYKNADAVVATFESFYQAILRGVDGARSIDAIILDDFHEIFSDFRGPEISKSISAALCQETEVYGISATIGNPHEIADWIGGNAVISPEGRQTPIRENAIDASTTSTKQAVIDCIKDNPNKGPYLVFCFAKSWTEARARAIAEAGILEGPSDDRNIRNELSDKIDGVLTKSHQNLVSMLENGVGYVHADLAGPIKQYILKLYEKGEIQAITTTTSLAYGFDSPVQTVIVADIKRRGKFVNTFEYIQWAGRAARPKYEYEEGYCHVLTKEPGTVQDEFFKPDREIENIEPHIDNQEEFNQLILELVVSDWDCDEAITEFLENTFYWHQLEPGQAFSGKAELVNRRINEAVSWLTEHGFINKSDTGDGYYPTPLGEGAVEFLYNSWTNTELQNIKAFYEWVGDTASENPTQLDHLYQAAKNFDIEFNAKEAEQRLLTALKEEGYGESKKELTVGIIRWYWMRNAPMKQIEHETDVDPTYIPGTARTFADTLDATTHLIEAHPNATVPEWHDIFIDRIEKGIRNDSVPLVEDIDTLGRVRVRNIRSYLNKISNQVDVDTDLPLWAAIVEFYNHTNSRSEFVEALDEQVDMVGEVTADAIADKIVQEDGYSTPDAITGEESIMSGLTQTTTVDTTSTESRDRSDGNTPTSLKDF